MKEKRIRLLTINDVKSFVSNAMECSCDIDICCHRTIIDGKSILGVLSLDLTKPLTVQLHGSDPEFENYLDTIADAGSMIA